MGPMSLVQVTDANPHFAEVGSRNWDGQGPRLQRGATAAVDACAASQEGKSLPRSGRRTSAEHSVRLDAIQPRRRYLPSIRRRCIRVHSSGRVSLLDMAVDVLADGPVHQLVGRWEEW